MMPLRNHRKGESIIEAVIALTILAIGISMVSTIIGSSLRSINASKNRIIAISIAREGIEAMRNIRDTNWLKFNSTRRECWNHDPRTDTCNDASEPILPGEYVIYKEPIDSANPIKGWKWRLQDIKENPGSIHTAAGNGNTIGDSFYDSVTGISYVWNGTEWLDLTQLYLVDVDPEVDSDMDHDYTNDPDAYNHALVEGDNAFGKENAKKTVFKRTLRISYLENDGTEITDPGEMGIELNRMRIRSTVPWQEGKFQFKTDLATTLTDYQGRENLDN